MKSYRSLIYFVAAAVLVSAFGIAEADANTARRDSLDGNRLIEDRDDIFQYPQLAVNYANRIGFDYNGADGQGSALMLMGNERLAYGVALHRGDLLRNNLFPYDREGPFLSGFENPLGFQQPGNIIDFFISADLGGGLAGARLSLGRGATDTDPADGDPSSNSQTTFRIDGGYSLSGPLTLDAALNLHFASADEIAGGETQQEGSLFGLGLSTRGYADMGQPFDLGFIADVVFSNRSLTDVTQDPDLKSSNNFFGIQAGAGPVWDIEDEAVVAGYAVLGYQRDSEDPNVDEDAEGGGPQTVNSEVLLPGFQLGADVALNDWLSFRSGAHYLWSINNTAFETPDGDDNDGVSGADGFGWNAGLGAEFGNFRFDGSLQHGFLVNGPNFIGGQQGFLALASAEYEWE